MKWPWTKATPTEAAVKHKREIRKVTKRLDVVEERVDVIADELAVLQQNGDEA